MPSSSRSSRRSASRGSSPSCTFPPGNSHAPARCVPALRRVRRTRPRSTITPAAASTVGTFIRGTVQARNAQRKQARFCALPEDTHALSSRNVPAARRNGQTEDAMSNAFASEDGNFKRGAFKPVAILIGLLLVGGAAVFFFLSVKQESASLTKEAVNKEIQDIQLLPKQEQIPRWRKWADTESEPRLRQEAFIHLAWAKDVQSLPSIAKGLTAVDHTVRGVAAMALVDFGSPTADPSKPMLLKAVTEATSADKPQICWALVALKEPAAFETIMAEYRLGHLAQVEKLDGYPAFDAEMLAGLVPIDKLASLAGDDSDSVRQLVATTLSRSADPKWTDTLIKLVNDRTVEVAREAAVGLGKIGNEKATQPLVDALSKADKASREKFLQALRDGMGANGLVLALRTVSHDKADTEKFQTKQIFDMLKELEDPRGGDALYQYVQTNSRAPAHWKVEAGMRMAEIGDVRAAEVLGWRMSQDPLKLYNDVDWPELRRY